MQTQLVQIDDHGRLVLPKAMRGKGRKRQYYTCVQEDDGTVHLIPVVGVITPRQAYFWTKRWQEGERLAESDIKKGRTRPIKTSQLDDYLKSL